MQRFVNNWAAELLAPATSADLELTIDAGLAAQLVGLADGDHYLLTLVEQVDGAAESAWEIVKVIGNAAGELIVQRGQEGTPAVAWPATTRIELRLTAAGLRAAGGVELSDAEPAPLGAAGAGAGEQASRHDHVHPLPTPAAIGAPSTSELESGLAEKVDKEAGKGLSQENFTPEEKAKLAAVEDPLWRGNFLTLEALQVAHPTGVPGASADVDAGAGSPVLRYIWDDSDSEWVPQAGSAAPITSAQVKTLLLANPDTNNFGDAEKNKLEDVAPEATANPDTDSLSEGSTNRYFTAARVLAVVLTGLSVATGGPAVSTDSVLAAIGKLQRQINDLSTAVAGKQAELISGNNIKTINGATLLGSGNLVVAATPEPTINETTTARTLGLGDAGAYVRHTNAAASTCTVPPQSSVAWAVDAEITLRRSAAGNLTITPGVGVTLNAPSGGTLVMTNNMTVSLKRAGVDVWDVIGQTVAA